MFGLIPFGKDRRPASREDFFTHMMANFFNEDFLAPFSGAGQQLRVDLKETDDAYLVEADLPGIAKEDISLQYADHYLTISAKRQEYEQQEAEGQYLRRERRYGEFRRSFYMSNVQEDNISAEFKNGVLKVSLPKQDKGIRKINTIPIQ